MRTRLFFCLLVTLSGCDGDPGPAPGDDGPALLGSGAKGDEFLGDVVETDDDATEEDTFGDASSADAAGPDAAEVDPWAMARDVTAHQVFFEEGFTVDGYKWAQGVVGFSLGGTEFWQKWTGGHNPTYNFTEGTAFGQRCMSASAKRFEAIMREPPQSILDLKEGSNWSGSFFNWNDDWSQSTWGDGTTARLWAWRTTLVKWISQTNIDGSCYLPTLEMVERLAEKCMEKALASSGEIVGCNSY